MATTGSVHVIKNFNRGLVLKEILKNAPFTKRALAERTALSFPTVSKVIDNCEAKQQIIRLGMSASCNGRKAALYEINPTYAAILCIYFQYDTFTSIVGNTCKKLVCAANSVALETGYIKTIESIVEKNLARNPNIHALAIGVPASVRNGAIHFINHYDELRGFDLKRHLTEKFGLQTMVERDMNVMMHAIYAQDEYAQAQNLGLVIVTADGPGSAALIDGHILKGGSGIAGEIGFLPLYDQANLQDLALQGFPDTDLTDYMAKIVTSIAVTTNPEKLVILKTAYAPKDLDKLTECCERYMPKELLPTLEISDAYHSLYQAGLLDLGRALLFEPQ